MPKKLLEGYLLDGISSVEELEMVLLRMQETVAKCANKEYKRLVEWQAERIVDEISLNQYQRPAGEPILSIAEKEVQRRVIFAEKNMQRTEFNFYMGAQVLIGEIDEKKVTYLRVDCFNDIYSKALKKIKELTPYTITEDDIKAKKEKKKLWDSINMKYQALVPMGCNLINYAGIGVDPSSLVFRAPADRAHDIAVEKIMNHLLSCYGCQQEIQPNKLMEYTLQAAVRIKYGDMQEAVKLEETALSQILPEVTVEMVTRTGMPTHASGQPAEGTESALA